MIGIRQDTSRGDVERWEMRGVFIFFPAGVRAWAIKWEIVNFVCVCFYIFYCLLAWVGGWFGSVVKEWVGWW